jgi:hypothetical protein
MNLLKALSVVVKPCFARILRRLCASNIAASATFVRSLEGLDSPRASPTSRSKTVCKRRIQAITRLGQPSNRVGRRKLVAGRWAYHWVRSLCPRASVRDQDTPAPHLSGPVFSKLCVYRWRGGLSGARCGPAPPPPLCPQLADWPRL